MLPPAPLVQIRSTTTVITVSSSTSLFKMPLVPFYSQFRDISTRSWQKVGCGIASLAMIIDYYSSETISVDALLKEGVSNGAYDKNAGWKHGGLILLSKKYGLEGESKDLTSLKKDAALIKLKAFLQEGPVMASIHYKFDPKNPIPHLVVLEGIKGDYVYYNDPATSSRQKKILVTDFQKAWKKKLIVIRPIEKSTEIALL